MLERFVHVLFGLGVSLAASGCGGQAVFESDESAGSSSAQTSGGCADHDDCPRHSVCVFSKGTCAEDCIAGEAGFCPLDEVCVECATSSCPACRDCVSACQAAAK